MSTFFDLINIFLGNTYVLMGVMLLSFFCKALLLSKAIRYGIKAQENRWLFVFSILFLWGALLDDAWYVTSLILRRILEMQGDIPNFTALFRIDWSLFITQYQAIALLFEYLIERRIKFRYWLIPHGIVNIGITGSFIYLLIFKYNVPASSPDTLPFEIFLVKAAYAYLPFLFIPLFIKIFRNLFSDTLPKILSYQLYYLTSFFIPYLLLEMLDNPGSSWVFCFHYFLCTNILSLRSPPCCAPMQCSS